MVDEIELHFENAIAIWNRRSRKSAGIHVKRNLPPMIDQRT